MMDQIDTNLARAGRRLMPRLEPLVPVQNGTRAQELWLAQSALVLKFNQR